MEVGVGRIEAIDVRFEPTDVALLDPVRGNGGRRPPGKLGLADVELVLEPSQDRTELGQPFGEIGDRESEVGPELVERPVGADAGGVLVYARTTGETGRSSIARAGVETRDALASGRHCNWSKGELRPWTGQNEMCSTSLCLASCRHSRQMNPLRSLHAIPIGSMLQPFPSPGS